MTDHPPLPRPPIPAIDEIALFLDVDGTLLSFADTPDGVHVSDALRGLLVRLHEASAGALALVSGRSLANLDRLFAPLELAAAGSHGLEIRTADGVQRLGKRLPDEIINALRQLAETTPGSLLEDKSFGAALHFRRTPEHGSSLTRRVRELHAPIADKYRLIEGDHVLELTAASGDKGSAIRLLAGRPPWRGRRPVFVGDDTTDEAGFAVVNDLGGLAIRVGPRAGSLARWQLDSTGDVQAWLRTVIERDRSASA